MRMLNANRAPGRYQCLLVAILVSFAAGCGGTGGSADMAVLPRLWVGVQSAELTPEGYAEYLLLRSDDGGQSWTAKTPSALPPGVADSLPIAGITFASRDIGWVVANTGRVFRTTDGGDTWLAQGEEIAGFFIEPRLAAVVAIDDRTVVAVGRDELGIPPGGSRDFLPVIVRSNDGGGTWSRAGIAEGTDSVSPLASVCVLPSGTGVAGGNSLAPVNVFTTEDGGAAWTLSRGFPILASIYSLACVASGQLWVLGASESYLLRSTDQGMTWKDLSHLLPIVEPEAGERPGFALFSIVFAEKGRGWIFGSEVVARDAEDEPTFAQLVLETTDGGDSWERTQLPDVAARVGAASGSNVVAFGRDAGLLYHRGSWRTFSLPGDVSTVLPAAIALVE